MNGVASNAMTSPADSGHMVLLGVSIVKRDVLAGAVVGVLDVRRLRGILDGLTAEWEITATVVDANGVVLVSTDARHQAFTSISEALPEASEHVRGNVYFREPTPDQKPGSKQRWRIQYRRILCLC